MGWFSILPENLSTLELWVAHIFILLGLLTIGPWAVLLAYDLLLYCWRSVTYEIPTIGGRARGKQRPRAPSLTQRPDGRPRRLSMAVNEESSPSRTSGSAPYDDSRLSSRDATRLKSTNEE